MVNDAVAVFFRDFVLQGFDFRIVEFRYLAAFHADDMVVVVAFVQFVNRLAGFKMVALQNACLLELGQHAVNRRYADFHTLFQQNTVHIFGTQMLFSMRLEQIQDFLWFIKPNNDELSGAFDRQITTFDEQLSAIQDLFFPARNPLIHFSF